MVVELEDVVDHLAFGLGDGTLFFTDIGHHADVLLGDAVLLRIGINAAEPKHAVGGNRQQPDQRFHHGGKAQNHAADHLGHRVGLLHGDALGNEFAENQREIGEDDGNQDHTDGIEDVLIHAAEGVRLHQCFDHRAGEIIRRESRSQKAGKRYGDLDGGEEAGRRRNQLEHPDGVFIAVFRSDTKFVFVQADHGDLRSGEECVDRDQNDL